MDFNYKYSYSINKIFIINKRLPTTSPQPTAQLSPAKNNCDVVAVAVAKKKKARSLDAMHAGKGKTW